MTMNEPYVAAEKLGKSYDGRTILAGIDATLKPGQVVGLLGTNGAGKTTLLELLLGLSPPSEGVARLFGHASLDVPQSQKHRIGYVPQRDELLDPLSARQQLDLFASFYPQWDAALVERLSVEWAIAPSQRVGKMSPGERQKLAIIVALAHRPELLVLDEPVASLDPLARRRFLEQIVEISADPGRAVLFSSHIVSDVERLANAIWILRDGRMLWQGDLDALKEAVVRVHVTDGSPEAIAAQFAQVVTSPASRRTRSTFVALRAAHEDWITLEQKLAGRARLEQLGLEDIFLELHS
jgi:ABC-2 type transport system ATP-binding protein